jgi:hypothetical protein
MLPLNSRVRCQVDLPSELVAKASRRGNEFAWCPSDFPAVLSRAEELGLACLAGQFQFRAPEATCEMYWLSADPTDRLPGESWQAYLSRSISEVRVKFSSLLQSTDFGTEALRWPDVPELSGVGAQPEKYLCFVAYFVNERPAPNYSLKRTNQSLRD